MTCEKWQTVTSAEPCPICNKPDWCRRSRDGSKVACRRESTGAVKTNRYKDGGEAYVHILREDRSPNYNGRPRAKQQQPAPRAKATAADGPSSLVSTTTSGNTRDTVAIRDAGYRCLLGKLQLSSDHRQRLKNRGLSDSDIEVGGYRTLPAAGRKATIKQVMAELGDDFAVVPGFVMSEHGPSIAAPAGLLVPVRNLAGQIVALKVRTDNAKEDQPKYLYLSSAKSGGPGPESPAHVPAGICSPSDLARITEGELKADVAFRLTGVTTLSFPGVASWRAVLPLLQAIGCTTARVAFDADARTNKHVARALLDCCLGLKAAGIAVELERWSPEAGKGIDDVLQAGKATAIEVLVGSDAMAAVEEIASSAGVARKVSEDNKEEHKSQATVLVELADAAEFWHTIGQGVAYATIPVANHFEHWPIKSRMFKLWLSRLFFQHVGKAPGAQALSDAINVLDGRAVFEGPEHPVFLRLAGVGDKVYLDLVNDTWQVVEIDETGWRVLNKAPVRFRRAKAMMPLPMPTYGGSIDELRRFANIDTPDWPLLLGWIVGAFRSTGPYPILALHGEQGSAKSTTARTLRSIIDPNAALLRSEPRNPQDLMIAANNGWVIALDNLSAVPVWLSDALCRLATGGGFATRSLFENDEETIFDAMRPAILTGIEELAEKSDLLDRSLILQLPRIPEAKRKTEAEHWREFREAHGRLLGAILDAVSTAVRNLPTTQIKELPRMADFALWATAAESGLGLESGEFLASYRGNRESANETALESSPVSKYVLQVADAGEWSGTSSELLEHLETIASDGEKRQKVWPKNSRSLSGLLKRLAPNLRTAGIEVEFGHAGRGRQKRRNVSIRKSTDSCVPCGPRVSNTDKSELCVDRGDARHLLGVDTGTQTTADTNPAGPEVGTLGDGGDAESHHRSNRVQVTI